MYHKGDYVVYKRDVCKVNGITEKKFNNMDYYSLSPVLDETLKIDVPVDNKLGLMRNLITKEELDNIIKKIPSIKPLSTTDKQIETEYKKLMNSGTHEDLIKIIKTTYLRNKERLDNNKKIGDKDNSYFELAEKYLYTEFMIVLGISFDETKEYVISKVKEVVK